MKGFFDQLHRPNEVDPLQTMFPYWNETENHRPGKTYQSPEVIPETLRTNASHKEDNEGGFETVEPVTVLRRCYHTVYVEIVHISYWIAIKEDGRECYQVNLVIPNLRAFDRAAPGIVSLDYSLGSGINEFQDIMDLLADARTFIRWHSALSHIDKIA